MLLTLILTQVITVVVNDLPHEETRKIIRVGNSYAVTMPRAWIRYFKLNDKDEVLVVSNGSIVIKPRHALKRKGA